MSDAFHSAPDTPAASGSGVRHMFYPYAGVQQYLSGVLAYIDQARADGADVVVAVPADRRQLLHGELPEDGTVTFVDAAALGRNPGRLIPAWQDWLNRRSRDVELRGIGESVWSGRTAAQLSELRYHEWLINLAFAGTPIWSLLCPFDSDGQPAEVGSILARCHPLIWNGTASVAAQQPAARPESFTLEPFGQPTDSYDEMHYSLASLPMLRQDIARRAAAHGLPAERVRDLVLAASEIASNSIRHGGGRGTLRTWAEDGSLICEFSDAGVITDPLAGRIRPTVSQPGGCGLWFVHQLCDLVELRSDAQDGTRVRLHMDLAADAQSRVAREHQPHAADL